MIPQRVEVRAALVHDFGEVGMEILGVERGFVGRVVLADVEGVEKAVQVLHVRDIASEAYDDLVVELAETLYVPEASERAV